MSSRRTEKVPVNIEGFEGMRTPLHQRRCQQGISRAKPRQSEFPEVDTAWEGQQSSGERFHFP
jgi:hypothetical protein